MRRHHPAVPAVVLAAAMYTVGIGQPPSHALVVGARVITHCNVWAGAESTTTFMACSHGRDAVLTRISGRPDGTATIVSAGQPAARIPVHTSFDGEVRTINP